MLNKEGETQCNEGDDGVWTCVLFFVEEKDFLRKEVRHNVMRVTMLYGLTHILISCRERGLMKEVRHGIKRVLVSYRHTS